VSRRRWIAAGVVLPVALLLAAATAWQGGHSDPRFARVLLLDPRSGKTLHEQTMDAGYAVTALLRRGRVAVATLDSCPDGKGGLITVLDAALQRAISSRRVNPCVVARIDPAGLRQRFEASTVKRAEYRGGRDVTVRLGRGRLVETYRRESGRSWLNRITAYSESGQILWQRDDLGRIGIADVRGGRVVVPVFGTFTPGSG
jgi:hypothetical protein